MPWPSAPQHERERRLHGDGSEWLGRVGVEAKAPKSQFFQNDKRARDVDDAGERHRFQSTRGGLGERAGPLRRMTVLDDDGTHRKSRRRAQYRADVMRIGHLIEHEHDLRPVCALRHAAAGRGKIDRRQRRCLQHDALMHGALRQQGGEVLAGDDLGRLKQGAGGERERAGVRPLGEQRCALLRRGSADGSAGSDWRAAAATAWAP